ncbi:MAG: M48 family metalloprotease, partial [Cardiobacteriaceae bacterium]|nr:M48 family metalloprotease [Cardiobacteriaceae bacterium]
ERHQQADTTSNRLQFAFWLSAIASYFTYSLACALMLFGIAPFMVAYAQEGAVSKYIIISLIFGLIPTAIMLNGYADMRRKMQGLSAAEQARSLGAEPTGNRNARDRLFTNIVAEMSAASGNPVPETFVLRKDDSINAFILGGKDDTLALTVSQGALNSLTRDELQAVIAHEYGHIENGDLAIYSRLTAMVYGYYLISEWENIQERIRTAPEANLFNFGAIFSSDNEHSFFKGILSTFGFILYIYGRILQAAFSRQREKMADARAVQYTRNPQALIGALKKAFALQHDGVRLLRPPLDRAHIYFIYYQSSQNSLLRTHPPLAERIADWGGGSVSAQELDAILFDIQEHNRDNYETNPKERGKSALSSNASYPLISLDRILSTQTFPVPVDPGAALIALFIYHSGANPFDIEQNKVIPVETLDAARNALNTIEYTAPLAQIPLLQHLTQATAQLDDAQKHTLDRYIKNLIKLDKHFTRYELTAYICWRAVLHQQQNEHDYRAHSDAIIYLYNYLVSDDPDDDQPEKTYQQLISNSLPITSPPYTVLDIHDNQSSLQLCRHLDQLHRLSTAYRQPILNAINDYYNKKQQITLSQAYLRFALQQTLA